MWKREACCWMIHNWSMVSFFGGSSGGVFSFSRLDVQCRVRFIDVSLGLPYSIHRCALMADKMSSYGRCIDFHIHSLYCPCCDFRVTASYNGRSRLYITSRPFIDFPRSHSIQATSGISPENFRMFCDSHLTRSSFPFLHRHLFPLCVFSFFRNCFIRGSSNHQDPIYALLND